MAMVKETILQIAEERSSVLISQNPLTAGGVEGIVAHLWRVQAWLAYVYISLFDGSVRLRASAEQQLPTLRLWVIWMWEAVRRYLGEDELLDYRPSQWIAREFESEYNASLKLWKLWILTESVRRTHLVVNTIANIYETMAKGWVGCTGAGMLTARRGLWEAESAMKWSELLTAKPLLLVPSLDPVPLISQYVAEDLDDFVKVFWKMVIGSDKMQSWTAMSNRASRT
ncbi:uncharacterized protein KY384_004826 [Bacidia gigantensis]|uniref:uncharacterized protein n=1 Tax=Bacidia gigantensis TaxID=2732470 RepID=UPI001D03B5BF|nr:uncharacterized protein KY384_004826 [Bacidia gigantensis]KAG8530324.1 hypothetical protein KY384_004826 [Bacidia gigantensis]